MPKTPRRFYKFARAPRVTLLAIPAVIPMIDYPNAREPHPETQVLDSQPNRLPLGPVRISFDRPHTHSGLAFLSAFFIQLGQPSQVPEVRSIGSQVEAGIGICSLKRIDFSNVQIANIYYPR